MAEQNDDAYDYASIDPGYYDAVFKRGAGIQSKWHHSKFRHVRRQMPADYERHLDIACGPGTFIGTLENNAYSLGVDLAEPQIQFAQREYGTESHEFKVVPAGKLPLEDESFDIVTLIELIEHLEYPVIEELLAESKRVLKPGGRVVLTTPNYGSLWPLLEKIVNARSEVSYEDQHITFFKQKRLLALLQGLKFTHCEVSTFQGVAPFLAGINWKLADVVQNIENPLLSFGMGFLLLGVAQKD